MHNRHIKGSEFEGADPHFCILYYQDEFFNSLLMKKDYVLRIELEVGKYKLIFLFEIDLRQNDRFRSPVCLVIQFTNIFFLVLYDKR